jgi:hypothetical protein
MMLFRCKCNNLTMYRMPHTPGVVFSLAAALLCLAILGCGASRPAAVSKPNVNPADAAAAALEAYDANGDGSLAGDELAKCPPLAQMLAEYDSDGNSQLTAEEISARLTRMFSSGSALMDVSCEVKLAGRPLSGANVKFRPVEMLADGLHPAEGVTDESGAAQLSIGDELLPENLRGQSMMQPGLYHVEITHPQRQLPTRYNTETELGFEVDPFSRGGARATFDLKP